MLEKPSGHFTLGNARIIVVCTLRIKGTPFEDGNVHILNWEDRWFEFFLYPL